MHRFDFKTIQYVELRLKTFKTTLNYESDQIIMHCNDLTSKRSKKLSYVPNYKSDQITMNCIDLMSKRLKQRKITNAIKLWSICIDLTSKLSKMLSYVSKNSKERKTTKLIKDKKNVELRRKTFKTTQNYKTDQIIMHCIDLTSKRSKLLS